jgi:Na+-translocating ferredoxin:NAD+ oxidoreductase RnfG subunit
LASKSAAFVGGLALSLLLGIIPVFAQEFVVRRFATEEATITNAFSDTKADKIVTVPVEEAVRKKMTQHLGSRWDIPKARWTELRQNAKLVGYALILEEIGKHQPITFCIILDAKKAVKLVAVLDYRESVGSDIRKKRFMKQFEGKTISNLPDISQTIPITGATLSSWAAIMAVKKALLIGNYIIP